MAQQLPDPVCCQATTYKPVLLLNGSADDTVNRMWMFSIKLKLLSTQAISKTCTWNNIDYSLTLSMHFGSRWLRSSLTTIRLSVCQSRATPSDIIVSIHMTALGKVSDRIEMACCHIRAKMGFKDGFIFGFHMTWWWQDDIYLIWTLAAKACLKKLLFCSMWCDIMLSTKPENVMAETQFTHTQWKKYTTGEQYK